MKRPRKTQKGPETLQKVGIGANQDQKWMQHPRYKGVPCCEPLGPTFFDRQGPLPGPAVGSRVDPRGKTYGAWAWVRFRTPKSSN